MCGLPTFLLFKKSGGNKKMKRQDLQESKQQYYKDNQEKYQAEINLKTKDIYKPIFLLKY